MAVVHLKHPMKAPIDLRGSDLESWLNTAKSSTLCWRHSLSQVKWTEDLSAVTCKKCLKMAAGR